MTPSARPTQTRLPFDPRLPGLADLLDPVRFAAAAAALLPAGERIRSCQPVYVRYKPGTNAVAVHALRLDGRDGTVLAHGKCHTDEDFGAAAEKAEAGRTEDAPRGRSLAVASPLRLLLFLYPHDQGLRGLRIASTPKRIQRALYALGTSLPEETWRISDSRMRITPIRFKPEKRAVLCIDTRARHRENGTRQALRVFARVDAGVDGEAAAGLMARLHDEFACHPWLRTPRVLGRVPEADTTLVADAGRTSPAKGTDGAATAGRALAALHGCKDHGLPLRSMDAILTAAAEALDSLEWLAPELADDARWIRDELARRGPRLDPGDALGFVHGDYHPQQLLTRPDGLTVLDFDRSYAGDQAADLGNFSAHLLWQALLAGETVRTARHRTEVFLASYAGNGGRVPPPAQVAFWTALGLAHLAPAPFRMLHRHWFALVSDLLAACRQELS